MENAKPSIVRLPDQILTSVLAHKEAYTLFVTNLSVIREHLIADLLLRKKFVPLPFYKKFQRKNLNAKEAFYDARQSVFEYLINNGVLSAQQIQSCTLHFQKYSYDAIYDLAGIPWKRREFDSTLYGDREITPAVHYVLRLLDVFFGHLINVYEELIGANEALHKEYLPRRNLALTEWERQQSDVAHKVSVVVERSDEASFWAIMAEAGYTDVRLDDTGNWTALNKNGKTTENGTIADVLTASTNPAHRLFMEAKRRINQRARAASGNGED